MYTILCKKRTSIHGFVNLNHSKIVIIIVSVVNAALFCLVGIASKELYICSSPISLFNVTTSAVALR